MAHFQSVKSHFDAHNLSYYSFYPKSEKPMKAVICHLPSNTPAEDISDELLSLGFDVISVKQMTATRWSHSDGSTTISLSLFLITCRGRQNHRKFSYYKASVTSQSGWRHIELRMVLRSAVTASSSATSRQTANNLPTACGAKGVTCTRSAPRKGIHLPPQSAAIVSWRKEINPIPQIIGAADTRRRRCRRRSRRGQLRLQRECCSPLSSLVHLTHLFNHCFRMYHFPKSWKEAKIITLLKPDKEPKFPKN
jgi:hypothetical protein